jgi:hypothetical protein
MELILTMLPQRTDQSLVSLPNSLQQQLDRAQNLLSQSENAEYYGDHSLAIVKAREAMQVVQALAHSSPESAALIILADMGYRGFEYETVEHIDRYQVIERKFCGLSFGHEVVNVPTITRRTVKARII